VYETGVQSKTAISNFEGCSLCVCRWVLAARARRAAAPSDILCTCSPMQLGRRLSGSPATAQSRQAKILRNATVSGGAWPGEAAGLWFSRSTRRSIARPHPQPPSAATLTATLPPPHPLDVPTSSPACVVHRTAHRRHPLPVCAARYPSDLIVHPPSRPTFSLKQVVHARQPPVPPVHWPTRSSIEEHQGVSCPPCPPCPPCYPCRLEFSALERRRPLLTATG
jgi:hypothetical protein